MAIIRRALPLLDIIGRDLRYAVRGMWRTPLHRRRARHPRPRDRRKHGDLQRRRSAADPAARISRGRPPGRHRRDAGLRGTPRPGRVFWQLDAAERWEESLRAFSDVTFYTNQVFQLSSRDGAELLDGATVAPSFFSAIGGPIVAGHAIAPADALTPSIVISERLAQRLFNGPSSALGAHLVLNSTDYVVIGVAGRQWDTPSWKTDVWESSAFAHLRRPQCCSVQLLGRLKPDVTIAQARADVADAARALATADPKTFGRLHTTATTLRDRQLGDGRPALLDDDPSARPPLRPPAVRRREIS